MRKVLGGLLALGATLVAGAASAHPALPEVGASQSLVQHAGHRHWGYGWGGPGWGYGYGPGFGCRRVRHICADRWGWGGPGFRRCMWRRGC